MTSTADTFRRAARALRVSTAVLLLAAAVAAWAALLLLYFYAPSHIAAIADAGFELTSLEERVRDAMLWVRQDTRIILTLLPPGTLLAAVAAGLLWPPPLPAAPPPEAPAWRRPVAWAPLLALVAVRLALHAYATLALGDGFDMDELHLLDSVDHLDWGYVDHPPLSILLLRAAVDLFGTSELVLRVIPALAGGATVLLGGLIARGLGGRAAAQVLAAATTLVSAYLLRTGGYFSMNALDVVFWQVAILLLVRLLNGRTGTGTWALLGGVLGVGLLNKLSLLWLGAGLAVGLLLTRRRRWLRGGGPYLAAGLALLGLLPYVLWNAAHGWPTLEFIRNSAEMIDAPQTLWQLMRDQVVIMGEPVAILAAGGAAALLLAPGFAPYRLLGWLWLTVHAIVFASGEAQPHYLVPLHPLAFAAGAVGLERLGLAASGWLGGRRLLRLLPHAATAVILAGSTIWVVSPLVDADVRHAGDSLRRAAVAVVRTVARAYAELPAADRERVVIYSPTYGFTAAINVLGAAYGLPRAISAHNSYWEWGPGDREAAVLLSVGPGDILDNYAVSYTVARVRCRDCEVAGLRIYLATHPIHPLREIWPRLKLFAP